MLILERFYKAIRLFWRDALIVKIKSSPIAIAKVAKPAKVESVLSFNQILYY
jgi:hypothetical protein